MKLPVDVTRNGEPLLFETSSDNKLIPVFQKLTKKAELLGYCCGEEGSEPEAFRFWRYTNHARHWNLQLIGKYVLINPEDPNLGKKYVPILLDGMRHYRVSANMDYYFHHINYSANVMDTDYPFIDKNIVVAGLNSCLLFVDLYLDPNYTFEIESSGSGSAVGSMSGSVTQGSASGSASESIQNTVLYPGTYQIEIQPIYLYYTGVVTEGAYGDGDDWVVALGEIFTLGIDTTRFSLLSENAPVYRLPVVEIDTKASDRLFVIVRRIHTPRLFEIGNVGVKISIGG